MLGARQCPYPVPETIENRYKQLEIGKFIRELRLIMQMVSLCSL